MFVWLRERVFSISAIHQGLSGRDNLNSTGIQNGFCLFQVIQVIHFRDHAARLFRTHQLLYSLPIANKWRCTGRYMERPTVQVVAQTVSNGMLDGSTTCKSCELAYSELYMFNSSHSSTAHSCQSRGFLWEVKHLPLGVCLPSLLSHSRMICAAW